MWKIAAAGGEVRAKYMAVPLLAVAAMLAPWREDAIGLVGAACPLLPGLPLYSLIWDEYDEVEYGGFPVSLHDIRYHVGRQRMSGLDCLPITDAIGTAHSHNHFRVVPAGI